jgi:hypothetical protein
MAMSRTTRLRLSPKKAARDFSAGTFEFCWIGARFSSHRETESCGGFSLVGSAPAFARAISIKQSADQ